MTIEDKDARAAFQKLLPNGVLAICPLPKSRNRWYCAELAGNGRVIIALWYRDSGFGKLTPIGYDQSGAALLRQRLYAQKATNPHELTIPYTELDNFINALQDLKKRGAAQIELERKAAERTRVKVQERQKQAAAALAAKAARA